MAPEALDHHSPHPTEARVALSEALQEARGALKTPTLLHDQMILVEVDLATREPLQLLQPAPVMEPQEVAQATSVDTRATAGKSFSSSMRMPKSLLSRR